MNELVEEQDFYFNEEGNFVLTAKYHLQRGNCCGHGCKHCPFSYINVPELRRNELCKTILGNNNGAVI